MTTIYGEKKEWAEGSGEGKTEKEGDGNIKHMVLFILFFGIPDLLKPNEGFAGLEHSPAKRTMMLLLLQASGEEVTQAFCAWLPVISFSFQDVPTDRTAAQRQGEEATESQKKRRAKKHEGTQEEVGRARGESLKDSTTAWCPLGS